MATKSIGRRPYNNAVTRLFDGEHDLPNITIKNNEHGFFGLDKIQEVKDHLKKINKKYIAFISDCL